MNPRQRQRRTEDMPAGERDRSRGVPATTQPAAEVPGPVSVPGPGPGTSTTDLPRPGGSAAAPGFSDRAGEPAPYPELAPCYCAEGGTCPAHPELVLVEDAEIEQIRWHSYDEAVAAAKAHRDRALEDAAARLDRATRAAYADYGKAVDGVDEAYDMARRAATRAHELAGQAAS